VQAFHIPVLLQPVLAALLPAEKRIERAIDGTAGAAGHSRALLEAGAESLLALDVDPQALALARENLAAFGSRAHIVHASYADMRDEANRLGWQSVDAILLDLGASGMQFDSDARGFAFRFDAPLDMRFDPTSPRPTAADILNTYEADELADLFYAFGEERDSRRIARAIIQARPVETTLALASLIERVHPRRHGDHIHPATRVFQALRIAVNGELETIQRALPVAIDLLAPGGRLAVISFHSLEDRLVKQTFQQAATDCLCPPRTPICVCGHKASVKWVVRKPITADLAEAEANPRSRSAKLRVIEKL